VCHVNDHHHHDTPAYTDADNNNNNEEWQWWWHPTNGVTTKPPTWHVTGGFQDNEHPSCKDPTIRDTNTTPTTNGAHGETVTPTHERQPHCPPTLSPPPTSDNTAHEWEPPLERWEILPQCIADWVDGGIAVLYQLHVRCILLYT
jgi:hypothetical protein